MNRCVTLFASTVGEPVIRAMQTMWPMNSDRIHLTPQEPPMARSPQLAIPLVAAILGMHEPSISAPKGYESEIWCEGSDADCTEYFEDWEGWRQHAARKVVEGIMSWGS